MVTKERIEELIRSRLKHVLLVAEASLPASQFQAFRKLTLDQFGKSGLERDLERVFREGFGQGKGRSGQE
jgi:hypothetical protein